MYCKYYPLLSLFKAFCFCHVRDCFITLPGFLGFYCGIVSVFSCYSGVATTLVLNRDSQVTVYCHPVNLKAALAAVAEKRRAKVTLFLSPGWPAE